MNTRTILAGGIMERMNIRSGRIYRQGNEPEYGVIFTANPDKSDNDLDLDPKDLHGALIGTTTSPESEEDKSSKFSAVTIIRTIIRRNKVH